MGVSKLQILEIKIIFNVTDKVERFVNVFAILGSKVYLIDAGVAGALEQISSALQTAGRSIKEIGTILLTHTHPDHIGCAKQIKGLVPQCKIYVSAKEKEWLEDIEVQYKERPIPNFHAIAGSSVQADALLHPGDSTALEDDIQLDVIDCSGHSHGSIGYLWKQKKVLFSGDAVPAVDDALIFSHLGNSIDTIHRLRELESLEVIYSAWEDSKQGAAIKDSLKRKRR
ncbi:MBL fold metallo-hydrolase [Ruminococcaceae bacterium OttesenSCG-928-L11]|nr:MBL fold metallo-hydrolase [Ruminococcaceae bacterium OttesenSCG-928-L11]